MAVSQWQPIETAPKDGTPVLIWASYVVIVAAYDEGDETQEAGWYSEETGYPLEWEAEFWCPLPDEPAEDQRERL